ncbi:hypothetical protein PN36_18895 [Candidatus Thiomargarita nelsonii]|uniref:Uncharacterized protein n=1 Tax=Candidatus Thiomargarita nelsonii TaxID=1003181 RepID=A0A0A6RUD5_9GAMM|nr:hypothetical protein PN36_18895 [Candidatus Thiomargarita nelsonii]
MSLIILLFISILLYSFIHEWAIIPIALILFGIGLGYLDRLFHRNRKKTTSPIQSQLTSLALLHLAAKHHSTQLLNDEIDKVYLEICEHLSEDEQRSLLESTWTMLNNRLDGALGSLPWAIRFFKLSGIQTQQAQEHPSTKKQVVESVELEVEKVPSDTGCRASEQAFPRRAWERETSDTGRGASEQAFPRRAWERGKQFLPSRDIITHIFMHFIWQNIGWFIGGFCLVSGSIFFVAYTSGFYNALAIFIILSLYSLILFWGGYQIRRRRPELLTSSSVLLTLGVLLVPLNMSAAVRLIQTAMPNLFLVSFALLLSIIVVGVFFIAIRIASSLIDRSLQAEHAPLFIALAALQFVKPAHWLILAGLHLTLLGILAYALRRFSQHWLQSIFIDQQKTAYYAAGTLVYAALVSFVLLTWGSGINLPDGYAGPFLMACCLLLLHVDIQFKQWVDKQALLSHFTFVIYALSILAILFSLSGQTLILTLALGALLYGLMLWQYLSLPPLYLLLAALSGLYALLILKYFPYHWHFLISLPGLMLLHRFAQKRDSIGLVCCRVMTALGAGLLAWSLFHAQRGEVAMLSALIVAASQVYPSEVKKIYQGYAVTALVTVALAYMPLYFGISWQYQMSSGLIVLAVLWAAWGMKDKEFLFNSSLLSLALSIILAAIYTTTFLPWLLFVVSGILLWMSLNLLKRSLFYAMLILLGAAGMLLKYYYFPQSTGRGVILLALGVWLLLWWFHYRDTWTSEKVKMVKPPLEQTMFLLWIIGLWRILEPVYLGTVVNPISLFWGALLTGLLAGYTRRLVLFLPLSILLLFGVLLSPLNIDWLPVMGASYALLLWLFTVLFFSLPQTWVAFLGWQGGYGAKGGRVQAEQAVHWTAFSLILLSVGAAAFIGNITAILFVTLGIAFLFFWQTGLRYHLQLHSYLLIASTCLGGFALYALISGISISYLLEAAQITPLLSVLAIFLPILAQSFVANPTWQTLYKQPLYHTAAIIYIWALINSLILFLENGHTWLPFILILLALAQLPLLRPLKNAAAIRGVGIGLLLSLAFTRFFGGEPSYILMSWGFILWTIANYGLPRLKAPWAIAPEFWPTLGLLFVLSGILPIQWETLLIVTAYLFLMFRNANWWWIPWIAALTLTSAGLSFAFEVQTILFIYGSILWANLLLVLSRLAQRYTNWKINEFSEPLLIWTFLLLGSELLINLWANLVVWAILLNVSFLHVLSLRSQAITAHIFLLSLLNTILLAFLSRINLPLLISLWTIGLLLFIYINSRTKSPILKASREAIINVMDYWLPMSFGVALISTFVMPNLSLGERLFNITLLSGVSLTFGLRQQTMARVWLAGGAVLLGVIVHVMWWEWLPDAQLNTLLPWYALQDALLAWTVSRLTKKRDLVWLLTSTLPILFSLACMAWIGHLVNFFIDSTLFGKWDHFAALFACLLLIILWWRNTIDKTHLIYGLALMIALLGFYTRLLWLGLAPINVWDTALLMCAAYILYSLHHINPSQPLYRLTLLMPILAILTVPLQLDSIYATSTLVAGATLYLLMQPRSQNNLPLYLGLLALNVGIYLWIPSWAENYKLLQLYTIPVAITVLLMLQLHQLELKPHILNATRLTALSALYASATLDVFMRPELSIFLLAIGISLGGVMLGIALRVRAFLYIGTLFLIFNVFGQLIGFYPEERLGKAIVLMVLGGLITGGMIWFNMQREALMQRIRIIRADLAQWE